MFPTLQGEATTGKAKIWSIRVFERHDGGVIETSHGYLGGKIQVNEKVITTGKNIGKKKPFHSNYFTLEKRRYTIHQPHLYYSIAYTDNLFRFQYHALQVLAFYSIALHGYQ